MPLEQQLTAVGKCQAMTKAGDPCAAPVLRGGIYCVLHSAPERAAQLGRKGGTRDRPVYESGAKRLERHRGSEGIPGFDRGFDNSGGARVNPLTARFWALKIASCHTCFRKVGVWYG